MPDVALLDQKSAPAARRSEARERQKGREVSEIKKTTTGWIRRDKDTGSHLSADRLPAGSLGAVQPMLSPEMQIRGNEKQGKKGGGRASVDSKIEIELEKGGTRTDAGGDRTSRCAAWEFRPKGKESLREGHEKKNPRTHSSSVVMRMKNGTTVPV